MSVERKAAGSGKACIAHAGLLGGGRPPRHGPGRVPTMEGVPVRTGSDPEIPVTRWLAAAALVLLIAGPAFAADGPASKLDPRARAALARIAPGRAPAPGADHAGTAGGA